MLVKIWFKVTVYLSTKPNQVYKFHRDIAKKRATIIITLSYFILVYKLFSIENTSNSKKLF